MFDCSEGEESAESDYISLAGESGDGNWSDASDYSEEEWLDVDFEHVGVDGVGFHDMDFDGEGSDDMDHSDVDSMASDGSELIN